MILGQPLTQVRRQQKRLLAIAHQEVLPHATRLGTRSITTRVGGRLRPAQNGRHGAQLIATAAVTLKAMRGADDSFWELVSSAAREGRRVLLLEKIARAAGQTRWFVIRSHSDVDVVSRAVHPGSAVMIYVDPVIALEGHASQEMLASLKPVVAAIRPTQNDLVALVMRDEGPRCDHDFLDPDEVPEWLKEHEGRYVCFRYYPQLNEEEAEAIVPDDDGVVRGHPH